MCLKFGYICAIFYIKRIVRRFIAVYLIIVSVLLSAKAGYLNMCADSIAAGEVAAETVVASVATGADTAEVEKKNFFSRFIGYFENANKEHPDKKFDVSFIGGPFYNSALGVGVGVVGSGLYRIKGCDRLLQPSNVSLFGSVSTTGFYMMGIRGNNIFPDDRFRINYTMNFYSMPSYYWGIGYDCGDNDGNRIKMDRWQAEIKGEFMVKIAKNLYAGALLSWDYIRGGGVDAANMYLFENMDLVTRNYGLGVTVQYDSRDFINNASRGVYVCVNQLFRPGWLWNDYAFSSTEFITSVYKQVWKGGLIAGDLRGKFNFGNPSWAMMSKLGGNTAMRGYYEGRYRDHHYMAVQVELRQNIWHRIGAVVWVGAGNVFHDRQSFKHILPNYGLGYRWEFKKRVNVRLDVGFGKPGQYSFMFNINEAF